eukprot:PhF_6_TR14889/c0_g1_i2/m.23214
MNKQYEKYQPPIPEPKKLSVDEIKESCERLSVVGLAKHKEAREKVLKKYCENPPTSPHEKDGGDDSQTAKGVLSKEQLEASVTRLYIESMKKSTDNFNAKADQVTAKIKNRYCGGITMTGEQWKAMGER